MSDSRWDILAEDAPAEPCVFVLFGCTGDLAARKLAPAIYQLAARTAIHPKSVFLGVGRRDWNDDTLRDHFRDAIRKYAPQPVDEATLKRVLARWQYQKVTTDGGPLRERIDAIEETQGVRLGRLFYLALAPSLTEATVDLLGEAGLASADGVPFSRLVVEKPIGTNLASANQLNDTLHGHFDESQLFRIDHYLGKETVQNLLVFRFANALFDPHCNRSSVERMEITTAETVGMAGRRGAYYDSSGALRDMVQNHMLQLLAMLTMERPAAMTSQAIRDARVKLLECIATPTLDDIARHTARGQYDGYLEAEGVAPDSATETFAACRLRIENDRWRGVPIYLRTGKCLARKESRIEIFFHRLAGGLIGEGPCNPNGQNRLTIRIAPDEGISLHFDAKRPGQHMLLRPVEMKFDYASAFASDSPEAYEHLLADAFRGDATLFIRSDETNAAWRVIDAIRDGWADDVDGGVERYAPGSWGPEKAERIFDDPYVRWLN